ncbi:MAG: MBL fold metallo-hydrolase [Spirochaetes bacterium]|nr:MBL fold metallo-hydrolase [Spirochaetota bacterium]
MFDIITLPVGPLQANCYILLGKKKAIIIDPGGEGELILEKTGNLEIQSVILTHGHGDHIAGCPVFVDKGIPICIGTKDNDMLLNPVANYTTFTGQPFVLDKAADILLKEGDVIDFENTSLSVIDIPGHTFGHIGICADGIVFTGDTLFNGSVGRTDLEGGDWATLEKSIKEKLYILADDTIVYPGHGPSTTIGTEKKYNSFIR